MNASVDTYQIFWHRYTTDISNVVYQALGYKWSLDVTDW